MRDHDLLYAHAAREFRMDAQMQRLAMGRRGDLGPQPFIEFRDFAPARMARAMDQRVAVGHHVDALQDQPVDDGVHFALVAGNGARGENDEIVGRELDRMFAAHDARHGSARLALAAGGEHQDFMRGQAGEAVERKQFGDAVEIAAFARHLQRALHGAAGQHDAPTGRLRRQTDRAQPRNIGGEGRDQHPALGR